MAEKNPLSQYMTLGAAAEFLNTDPGLEGQIHTRDVSRLIGAGRFPYIAMVNDDGVEARVSLTDLQGIRRGMPGLQEELQEIARDNGFPEESC